MIENKKWLAVRTQPKWEKKVSQILSRKKIENYCPLNKTVRQWSDRKKVVHKPLFPSYVFVRITGDEYSALRQIPGIINFVYWLGKPAEIREYEIERIKKFLNSYLNIQIEKIPININEKVRILSDSLMEFEGKVVSLKPNTNKILLPSLGYMMHAEVKTNNIIIVPSRINASDQHGSHNSQIAVNE